jgi:hypothetical protein
VGLCWSLLLGLELDRHRFLRISLQSTSSKSYYAVNYYMYACFTLIAYRPISNHPHSPHEKTGGTHHK